MTDFQPGCYYGHSANDAGRGVPELLRDHLTRVADYAARFAAAFGAEDQARAAGLAHKGGRRGALLPGVLTR